MGSLESLKDYLYLVIFLEVCALRSGLSCDVKGAADLRIGTEGCLLFI